METGDQTEEHRRTLFENSPGKLVWRTRFDSFLSFLALFSFSSFWIDHSLHVINQKLQCPTCTVKVIVRFFYDQDLILKFDDSDAIQVTDAFVESYDFRSLQKHLSTHSPVSQRRIDHMTMTHIRLMRQV